MVCAAEQFDGRNCRRRTAAHAVVQGNHLRHIGHSNPFAADPREDSACRDRDYHQHVIGHSRKQERHYCRNHHARAGPDDTATRGHWRTHSFQTEDEQNGRRKVACLDQRIHGGELIHQPFSLLLLNISSMRSVTT